MSLVLSVLCAPLMAAEPVTVPSGVSMSLTEVLIDEGMGEPWVHFRFVAPELSEASGADLAAKDMDHLCQSLALPYLDKFELTAARVVIALSDRPVEFGASDPEATQFFETYRPENARCIWEGF